MYLFTIVLSVVLLLVLHQTNGEVRASERNKAWVDECGTTKTCFATPSDCLATDTCVARASVVEQDGVFFFELESVGGIWAAVGLSNDSRMGSDSVVECVLSEGNVDIFVSFNSGKSNNRIPTGAEANGVTLVDSVFVDGAVRCSFTRNAVTNIGENIFDLVNTPYHLLLAAGTSVITNPAAAGLAYHDIVNVPSAESRLLGNIGMFS